MGIRWLVVFALALGVVAVPWSDPAGGQAPSLGTAVAEFLLGAGGALDGTGAGARSLATGGNGFSITTPPWCYDTWCGALTVSPPVLLAAYKHYLGTTPQKPVPGSGGTQRPGQSVYWYYNQGGYIRVVYWDDWPNNPGTFTFGEWWGCYVSWPASPGPRYYVDIVSSLTLRWWWPDGQQHGCGPCFTGPISAIEEAVSCVRAGVSNETAANPWTAPTQQDANTWVRTQIDGGHWMDVVKPHLDAAIRAAATWEELADRGVKKKPWRIAVDAGHGPDCPGAISPTWPQTDREDVLVQEMALQMASDLNAEGHTVILTRPTPCEVNAEGETEESLARRVRTAIARGAEVLISIHLNGAKEPDAHGTEALYDPRWTGAFYGDASTRSLALAQLIQREQVSLGLRDRGVIARTDLGVLRHAGRGKLPAVIDEVAFLTNTIGNPSDGTRLHTPAFRVLAARAIENGTKRFLGTR